MPDATPGSKDRGRLFANRLFNEDALKNSAELEPIDNPATSTAPHHPLTLAALGVVLAGAAAWLALGSVDHSLWLNAERVLDTAHTSPAPDHRIPLRTEVADRDGSLLRPGMTAYLFQNGFDGIFVEGSIARVAPAVDSWPTTTASTVVIVELSPKDPPAPQPDEAGPNYRLRIPIGQQTPLELLVGLIRQRAAG